MSEAAAWIPVALSQSIEAGTSAGAVVNDREIVVWRDTAGAVHAWEDRCPHRGMRLSFGFVRGDHIACLYHGWKYDASGRCRSIPAHPDLDVPKTICVPTYSVCEENGIVWMSFGSPDNPVEKAGGGVTSVRSLFLACCVDDARDVLGRTDLPAFTSHGSRKPELEVLSDKAWLLSNETDTLLAGVQPVSRNRTGLHLVICGEPATYGGAGQGHFARWAEGIRGAIELSTGDQ